MRITTVVVALVSLFATAPLHAQEERFFLNFSGGLAFTLDDVGERFNTGWGPAVGVTFEITPQIGVQGEYAYRFFSLRDELDELAGRLDAKHRTHQLDFNLVASLAKAAAPIRPYVLVGPGLYHRSVEITRYEGTGFICDPWLYVCGDYDIQSVVGSRGGWDVGFNVGGGIGYRSQGFEFYVETRYHYVSGPEISTNTGLQKINGAYFPVSVGFRY